jgi:hypothetical protein
MSTSRARQSPRRRWRGPLLALGVGAALLFALELSLRVSVRSGAVRDWPLLGALGDPANFGDPASDEAYWNVLHWRTAAHDTRGHPRHDRRLGWRSGRLESGTLEHSDESALGDRRPVLLFGDSFAAGIWPETVDDFTRLFERTDLAEAFALLNHGSGGYGLDQIVMLLSDVLPRHAARRPVALVSLLVDDDIDRCVLAFRVWPKPRLSVVGGRLVGEERPVPTLGEYLEHHQALGGLLIDDFTSHLWRRVDGSGRAAPRNEKQALARALLERAVGELRFAGVEFLFVLFRQGSSIQDPAAGGWRARVCIETLDGLGAPWVDVGPALAAHAARTGRPVWDYFLPDEHRGAGHYDPLGDAVVFEVLREGLREHLGLGRGGDLRVVQDVRPLEGDAANARWSAEDVQLTRAGLEGPYLDLQRGLVWQLDDARSLRALVHLVGGGEVELVARRDGAEIGRWPLAPHAPVALALELRGASALELRPEGFAGDAPPRVVLREVALELLGRRAPPTR